MSNKGLYILRKITSLIAEIVSNIPEYKLSNPSTTYFIPDGAGGQEAKKLMDELRKRGFSDSNIASRIFIVFEDELSRDFAVNQNNLLGNFIVPDGGFLSMVIRNKMLLFTINKKQYSMNFDICLGNPPYELEGNKKTTSKLWHKFIKKSREILKPDGYLSFVVPSFYTTTGEGYKIFNTSTTSKNLLVYNYKGKAFDAGINVCYFLEQNKNYEGSTLFNGKIHDFREGFIYEGEDAIFKSIIDKVIENDLPKLPLKMVRRLKEKCNKEGIGFPVYFSGRKRSWIDEPADFLGEKKEGSLEHGVLKLVFPHSSSYRGQFTTVDAVCTLNHYIKIGSELEGTQIMSYTKDPLLVKIASIYKRTAGFTPLILHKMIPDLERKIWTSSELYKFFDLTEEEIEWATT